VAGDTIVGIVADSCCRCELVGGLVAVIVSWFANNGVQAMQPLVSSSPQGFGHRKLVGGIIAVIARWYDHLCHRCWLVEALVVTSLSVVVIVRLSRLHCGRCHDCTVAIAVVLGGLFSWSSYSPSCKPTGDPTTKIHFKKAI
jgi:hypothetical protein